MLPGFRWRPSAGAGDVGLVAVTILSWWIIVVPPRLPGTLSQEKRQLSAGPE